MKRTHGILAGVLAIQAVLALFTWSGGAATSSGGEGVSAAFDFMAADISTISIIGEQKPDGAAPDAVRLARVDGGWVVASAGDYPAVADKVDAIAGKLAEMKVGRAIASRRANHEALGVGARSYGRRVSVDAAGGEHALVFGRGARQSSHVRVDDGDDVFVTKDLGVWNLRADARNYIEIGYVDVDRQTATEITLRNEHGTLSFSKSDAGWALAELPPGAEQDAAAVGSMINSLTRISLHAPVGGEIKPSYGLDADAQVGKGAQVTIKWESEEDGSGSVSYAVGAAADERSYYAKAANHDHVVTIAKHAAEQALTKKAADFVKKTTDATSQ